MPSPSVTPPLPAAAAHLDAVRRRLNVTSTAVESSPMLLRNYRFSQGQAPDWTVLRERQFVPHGYAGVFRLTQVMLASKHNAARELKLEVYETQSHEAAHLLLLELLTGFHVLPEMINLERGDDGEAVSLPGGRVFLWTRGNLAMAVTDVGNEPQAVREVAQGIETVLTAAPIDAPATRGVADAEVHPSGDAGSPMQKFIAPAGSLHLGVDGAVTLEGTNEPATTLMFDEGGQAWRTLGPPAPAVPELPPG